MYEPSFQGLYIMVFLISLFWITWHIWMFTTSHDNKKLRFKYWLLRNIVYRKKVFTITFSPRYISEINWRIKDTMSSRSGDIMYVGNNKWVPLKAKEDMDILFIVRIIWIGILLTIISVGVLSVLGIIRLVS